jgi:hypothetical protein
VEEEERNQLPLQLPPFPSPLHFILEFPILNPCDGRGRQETCVSGVTCIGAVSKPRPLAIFLTGQNTNLKPRRTARQR